jgi:hypothetical protein
MAGVMVKTKHGAVTYVVMTMMAATVPMMNAVAVAAVVTAMTVTHKTALMKIAVQIVG